MELMMICSLFLGLFVLIGFGMNSQDKVEIEKIKAKNKCCGGGCHEEKKK